MSHGSIGGLRVIGIGVESGMRRMVTYHCVVSIGTALKDLRLVCGNMELTFTIYKI